MNIKQAILASFLSVSPAAINLAIKRGNVIAAEDRTINTHNTSNYDYILEKLTANGQVVSSPAHLDDLLSHFIAQRPPRQKAYGSKPDLKKPVAIRPSMPTESPEPGPAPARPPVESSPDTEEFINLKKEINEAKLTKLQADANSAIFDLEVRRGLYIKREPFVSLLMELYKKFRFDVMDIAKGLAPMLLADLRVMVDEGKSESEMILFIQKKWQDEIARTNELIDRETVNKINHIMAYVTGRENVKLAS